LSHISTGENQESIFAVAVHLLDGRSFLSLHHSHRKTLQVTASGVLLAAAVGEILCYSPATPYISAAHHHVKKYKS
jgi:hypothetical protein